jgi:Mg2+ and Co2+ transporter CorA
MGPVTVTGLITSVEQLAEVATTIVGSMYSYYEAVRDAPNKSKELRREMVAMSDQLSSLETLLFDNSSILSQKTERSLVDSISEIKMMLLDIKKRIQSSSTKGLKRLKWPFSKDENEQLLSRLEHYNHMLNIILNVHPA